MSENLKIIEQSSKIEKIRNFFLNNLKKITVLSVSILLFLFSYFGYQEYKKRIKIGIAETYNQITLKEITAANTNDIQKLIEIIKESQSIQFCHYTILLKMI